MSSTQMTDPRELFLHELGDILYAEQTLAKALPTLQEEASDDELAKGFGDHLEETRQHVKNVKQAFEELGEPVKAEKCPGIDGIKKNMTTSSPTSRHRKMSWMRSSLERARGPSATRSPRTRGS